MKAYSDKLAEVEQSLASRKNIPKSDIHNIAVNELVDKMLSHNARQGKYVRGRCAHCGEHNVRNDVNLGGVRVSVHPECFYDWWGKARNWVANRVMDGG